MTKSQIRSVQREQRDKITSEEQLLLSRTVREKLFETEAYKYCKRVFTFVSFGSEIDTRQLIRDSFVSGKEVFIPRVESHGMEFYRIHDLQGLVPSKFGVLEPISENDKRFYIPMADMNFSNNASNPENLMLLPGLAFDLRGNRIGYGAGYYDKYLAEGRSAQFYKVALAYDFQILEEIPTDEFDIKADVIITPTKNISCS